MRRALWLIALLWASPGYAAVKGSCLLRVDGVTYIDPTATCNIDEIAGTVSIAPAGRGASRHFAFIDVEPGTREAKAYWNGTAAESHAHDPLGILVTDDRDPACWISNRRAERPGSRDIKICAWRSK